ncbi:hypothetical protein NWE55_01460 [Myroides albus]|uniref:Uncharacterized protein n=1 Tax=Myroides albus TaxID=2562892 RepID=A0A6I3LTT3_9FLAO|nr:hypothetical protein [Myroides albus]MTG99385.1 hypothetical protein [Myroides albus]UVD79986.1 hypothetical protein NWE55_01460 [Myroides albus]
MRKILLLFVFLFSLFMTSQKTFSQQAIIGTKANYISSSSILEFPDNDTRGVVLPKVDSSVVVGAVEGTLIFDVLDKKVKYCTGNGMWEDLSINEGVVDTAMQDGLSEVSGARTLIGNDANISTEGVLVLDSTNQALVLPRVESPHLKMISPSSGTIVYDTKSNMICIFNGKEWAFWGNE